MSEFIECKAEKCAFMGFVLPIAVCKMFVCLKWVVVASIRRAVMQVLRLCKFVIACSSIATHKGFEFYDCEILCRAEIEWLQLFIGVIHL